MKIITINDLDPVSLEIVEDKLKVKSTGLTTEQTTSALTDLITTATVNDLNERSDVPTSYVGSAQGSFYLGPPQEWIKVGENKYIPVYHFTPSN